MTDIVKRRLFFVVIGILIIILALCLTFWGYMQINLFESYDVNEKPIENYLSSLESGFVKRTQDNRFTGFIPISVINDELRCQVEKVSQSQGVLTEGILVDVEQKWAKINYRKHMTVPVYHELNVFKKQEGLLVELVPKAFGKKQIKLPSFIRQWIFGFLIEEPIKVKINYDTYKPDDYFEYTSSALTDEGLYLNYVFYVEDISTILSEISQSANSGLINIYETGTKEQQEALRFLREHHTFPENIMGLIYEDFYNGASIIEQLLILANTQLFNEIMQTYPMLDEYIDRETILDQRAELLNQATIKYGRTILKKFDALKASENIVSHYGYFFDLNHMEPVTIELIVDLYGLKIPYDDFKKMRLIMLDGMPYVLYDTQEERYFLISEKTHSLISEEEYQQKYSYERPAKGHYTKDAKTYDAIYKAIEDALGEEIYIRYMKDDGTDAFVVYSSRLNFQDYAIALLKDEGRGFELLDNRVRSIEEINQLYPEFNLNLITRKIETTQVEIINTTTRQAIKEGLVEYGYMSEEDAVVYVSYDGNKYIAVMTDSGEQFIYTIYKDTFLERVYRLDDALDIFDDINPILFIQKRPIE
ncbi:hypothetical protein QBE53_13765 [Vallitaleaceae bacterium 9-2]